MTAAVPIALDARSVIVDLLQCGHDVQFRVRGDSMHPVIRSEDVVHVEAGRAVQPGDVALTLADRGLTAHRVLTVRDGTIVTRGDNALHDDPPLPLSRVLGRVIRVNRAGTSLHVRPEPRLTQALRRLRNWLRGR